MAILNHHLGTLMTAQQNDRQAGFSAIEATIAAAVIGIAITALWLAISYYSDNRRDQLLYQ